MDSSLKSYTRGCATSSSDGTSSEPYTQEQSSTSLASTARVITSATAPIFSMENSPPSAPPERAGTFVASRETNTPPLAPLSTITASTTAVSPREPCFPCSLPIEIVFMSNDPNDPTTYEPLRDYLIEKGVPPELLKIQTKSYMVKDTERTYVYLEILKLSHSELRLLLDSHYEYRDVYDGLPKQKKKQDELCKEAKADFASTPLPPKTYSTPANIPLDALSEELLSQSEGFCLGESSHQDMAPKRFLINEMQKLKDLGVTTLFLEHFFCDTIMQEQLDAYHKSESDELPLFLKSVLSTLKRYIRDYEGIIIAAKKAGIRVVGIDTSISYETGFDAGYLGTFNSSRFIAMNYVANTIIRHEKGEGKFVALIGSGHGSKMKDSEAPGLADLLGIPFIVIQGSDKHNPPKAESNVSNYVGKIEHIDHLYTV